MKRFKRLVPALFAVLASTLIVMCGPSSMGMLGDAMVDAGRMLSDSSSDATSDAQAQDCATSCTSAGVQRIMTADTDPAQLVTETVIHRGSGSAESFEVVSGPLVLTDIGLTEERDPHLELRIMPLPDCPPAPVRADPTSFTVLALDGQSGGTSVTTTYAHEIHGGRYYIPAGSRVCAFVVGTNTWEVRYAGFRPYD